MIDLKNLKTVDPLTKQAVKELDQMENSPMDPPSAYESAPVNSDTEKIFHQAIKTLMDEHVVCLKQVEDFEKALTAFKTNGYKLDGDINPVFSEFFKFFDNNLMKHNEKEDKILFPLLHKRLIEAGEHSVGDRPMTAIDVMEDDHIKFIQLGALTFNLLGVGMRLQDMPSRNFVFDVAFENGRELVELLKLHIYREDQTLFPLAQKFITNEELDVMNGELKKYD